MDLRSVWGKSWVGTKVDDFLIYAAENKKKVKWTYTLWNAQLVSRLWIRLTLRVLVLILLVNSPFEIEYLKKERTSLTHQSQPTRSLPSCMKLFESITLPNHQWHDLFAQTRLYLVICTNWTKMCGIQVETCKYEGQSQSERIKLKSERIKLKLPFRRPNLKAWLTKACPEMMFDFRSHNVDLVYTPDRNWNEMCSRAIALTGV